MELTRLACGHYNQWRYDRSDFVGREATPAFDLVFLHRISVSYLLHTIINYDAECGDIFGKVGAHEGYMKINRKTYVAIAAAYPALAFEYQRQMDMQASRVPMSGPSDAIVREQVDGRRAAHSPFS